MVPVSSVPHESPFVRSPHDDVWFVVFQSDFSTITLTTVRLTQQQQQLPSVNSVCTCAKGKDFKCVKPDPDDGQEITTCPEEDPFGLDIELTCGKALSCGYNEFRCCPTDDGFPLTRTFLSHSNECPRG